MEDFAYVLNASATFEDVYQSGPPSDPISFPPPVFGKAVRVDAPVYNPVTHDVLTVSNVIYEERPDGQPPQRAYWVGRKLKNCIFGVVKACTVLKVRNDAQVPFEVTPAKAAVKIMAWQKIRDLRHVEDPQKEVAAMQLVSQDGPHPHVMGVLDVLADQDYLLMFMPFCSSGDLFGVVEEAGRFPEPLARYWFHQILDGLTHLQRMGVCHRDMSLENILVDEGRTSVIIDMGMCLRVPFGIEDGGVDVSDVTAGTLRRLIKPLVPCGKPNYIAPEVLKSKLPFDGYAIDLWAAAVILFIMLVGLPPWEFAREEDARFRLVMRGGLRHMLRQWGREVSPLAADLLQRMLQEDPRARLSLEEVKDHEWMKLEIDESMLAEPEDDWRR